MFVFGANCGAKPRDTNVEGMIYEVTTKKGTFERLLDFIKTSVPELFEDNIKSTSTLTIAYNTLYKIYSPGKMNYIMLILSNGM